MAGKLPPRELYMVNEDVLLSTRKVFWSACGIELPCVPRGTVCQVLLERYVGGSVVAEPLIYCMIGRYPFLAWVDPKVLRPYDPQQDAETKKLECPGSGEMPPRGRCTS